MQKETGYYAIYILLQGSKTTYHIPRTIKGSTTPLVVNYIQARTTLLADRKLF